MFNKKQIAAVALSGLASLLMTSQASAEAYVGGQLGWGDIHQAQAMKTDWDTSKVSDTGLAGRLFAGYNFTENFALEAGYTKFSDATSDSSSPYVTYYGATTLNDHGRIKTYAVDVVGKATLPLDKGFSLYGKLGAAYLNEKASESVTIDGRMVDGFPASATYSKVLPTFGLGAGYEINKNVSADISWMHIQKTGNTQLANTDFIGVGLSYHFG